MVRRLLLSTTALAALSGYAMGADLTSRPPPPPFVPPPPMFSWTGFYVGALAGVGFSNTKTTTAPAGSCDNYDYCSYDLGSTSGQNVFGTLGGTLGYNYEFPSHVVLGLEADFSWAGLNNGSHSSSSSDSFIYDGYGGYGVGTETYNLTTETRLQSFGTARVRLGYAFDRTLVYLTGGLAFANVKSRVSGAYSCAEFASNGKYSSSYQENDTWSGSSSKTKLGFTVGAGIEHALSDTVSVKLEGLYYNLGSVKTHANGSAQCSCTVAAAPYCSDCGSANPTMQPITSKHTVDGAIVRLGLNVKF